MFHSVLLEIFQKVRPMQCYPFLKAKSSSLTFLFILSNLLCIMAFGTVTGFHFLTFLSLLLFGNFGIEFSLQPCGVFDLPRKRSRIRSSYAQSSMAYSTFNTVSYIRFSLRVKVSFICCLCFVLANALSSQRV